MSETVAAYHAEDPVPLHARPRRSPDEPEDQPEREITYAYTPGWQHEHAVPRAEWGMRGRLNRLLPFNLAATPAERSHRSALSAIRRSFPAHRTVCVANPKGGAGKTPAAMLIGEVFATQRREASVVGDLNPLRGTLGIRAGVQDPPYTIMDVLQHQEWLQRPGSAVGDLARFLRRQESGALVLASSEHAGEMRSLTTEHCQVVRDLLMTRYSTLILDTGNNEADATWQFAVSTADVLVVPMRASRDHLWVAARMMAGLQVRPRMQQLTRNAIAVVSDPDGQRFDESDEQWLAEHFAAVLYVPPDPAIAEGPLRFDRLSVTSRRAWTLVGAAVAEACARPSVLDLFPSQVTTP
jgi:MinD-like ATPase involved in chromosome partitioning or flagellar assembly